MARSRLSDLAPGEERHHLRARDFLSAQQCEALVRGLLQTCLTEGVDPNDGATPAQCDAVLDWAADIVYQMHTLLEVIDRQAGVAALRAKRPGKYQVVVLRPIVDAVIANAMAGGISASARTK